MGGEVGGGGQVGKIVGGGGLFGGGGGRGVRVGGVRVDVIEELKLLGKFTQKKNLGGGGWGLFGGGGGSVQVGGWGGRGRVWGSGWM